MTEMTETNGGRGPMQIISCKLEEPKRATERMFLVFHIMFMGRLFECVLSEFVRGRPDTRQWVVDVYLEKKFVTQHRALVAVEQMNYALFFAVNKAVEKGQP